MALGGPRRVGVEHELRLWSAGAQVDFRTMLPAVAAGLRTLDPGDPRARRLPSGVALTADGREAELATPPVPWAPGAPARLEALLAAERSVLAARAAEVVGPVEVTGFSTHVNLGVPDAVVVDVGERFTRHCGLVTALVGEPRSSSGLLVRPRRGRLEIGGEYAEGAHLLALVTYAGTAVSALLDGALPPELPPPVVVPSREKYGWFLPPEGAYRDLLGDGAAGRDLLRVSWDHLRPWCVRDGVDPDPVDRLVHGAALRSEDPATAPDACVLLADPSDSGDAPPPTGPRRLADGIEAETLWLTWSHVVWAFTDGRRHVHAVLPIDEEPDFLASLDDGRLDEVLRRELRRRIGRRRLLVHAQVGEHLWWHEVRPGALVPAERGPDGAVPRVSRRLAARRLRSDSVRAPR